MRLKRFNENDEFAQEPISGAVEQFSIGDRVAINTSCYEIVIEFMQGDTDGYEKEKLRFPSEKIKDPEFKEYLIDFINSIKSCLELDAQGRVGFDEDRECSEWYATGHSRMGRNRAGLPGSKSWSRFCQNCGEMGWSDEPDFFKEFGMEKYQDKNNPLSYWLPSDDHGYYSSYESLKMFYYNDNGVKYNVNV